MPNQREQPLPISSSRPPVFCAEQEKLFREVMELMRRNKVQCVVSGAFALHEHTGIWRDTKDLDLFMPANEVARALMLLEMDGFPAEIVDAVWLAKGAIKTGTMGPDKTIAAVRDYIAAFLDANLQGRPAAGLLNGPSSDYPDAVVTTQEQALCHQP